jgi:hypothetical protein
MGKCTLSAVCKDHRHMTLGEVRDSLDRACRVLTALQSLPEPALLGPAEDPRVPGEVARSLDEILRLREVERELLDGRRFGRFMKLRVWISVRARHALRGLVLSGRGG